jgi:hypothetical protein
MSDAAKREPERDRAGAENKRTNARRAAVAIIARRKGVTLGGLKIKDLINEGRR